MKAHFQNLVQDAKIYFQDVIYISGGSIFKVMKMTDPRFTTVSPADGSIRAALLSKLKGDVNITVY